MSQQLINLPFWDQLLLPKKEVCVVCVWGWVGGGGGGGGSGFRPLMLEKTGSLQSHPASPSSLSYIVLYFKEN